MSETQISLTQLSLGLTLSNISMVFTLFVVIISFKLYYHKKFSTELIIYVLISEILISLAKFIFLIPIDNTWRFVLHILRVFLSLFLDSITLVSILVHTIKIYDAIIRESQWFTKLKFRVCFRIFIFTFSLLKTVSLIIILWFDFGVIRCSNLFCDLSSSLTYCAISVDFLLFGVMFGFIIYSFCFLKKALRNNQHFSLVVVNKIQKVTFKVWLFPITTFFYWVLRRAWNLLFPSTKEYSRIIREIIESPSAAFYAVLLIYTQDTLKSEIKRMICCCCQFNANDSFISTDNEEATELFQNLFNQEGNDLILN